MPTTSIFHWPEGRGWLVLSGGVDSSSEIRAQAIGRMAADGGVAYVTLTGSEAGERVLDDMLDLGAPSGYLVDVTTEDDPTVTMKLADAGMVVIESGVTPAESRSGLLGAAIDGVQAAYENGGLVLVEGHSAMAFGAWVVRDDGTLVGGLDWLQSALVAPGVMDAGVWGREILLAQPLAYVLGIGPESALALGPDGQVEAWGKREITVALGQRFTSDAPNE